MSHSRFNLFVTISAFIFIIVITPAAAAQATPSPQPSPRTSADEEFELNISERHINEADYEASTEVEAGDVGASGLTLRVGVALRAAEIDVLLRNVRGRVRFRGSLESVLRRLGLQRRDATAPLAPPSPSSPSP